MKHLTRISAFVTLLFLQCMRLASALESTLFNTYLMEKQNFYCEYCGHKFPSVRLLPSATCPRHPDGSHKGRHKLYEGTEKKEYTCKYCGRKFPSILVMVGGTCLYHPKGSHQGAHAPAL